MARILYAVMGNTHGHVMRALALATRMPENEFFFVGGGRVPGAVSDRYPCLEIPVLLTIYKENRIYIPGLLHQIFTRVKELPKICALINDLIEEWKPDLIIVDREFFTPIACRYFRKDRKTPRIIALNHSGLLLSTRYPVAPGQWLSWMLAMLNDRILYDFTTENYSVSFYHPALKFRNHDRLLPPVVREEVTRFTPSNKGHVLVYQSTPTFKPLIDTLRSLQREVIIYGFRNEDRDEGNIHYRAYSPDGILRDLASCAYAVVNGGHNLICEALYYKKPVLCFPVTLVFEQFLNVSYIRKLGYGNYCLSPLPGPVVFELFEKQLDVYRSHLHEHMGDGTAVVTDLVRNILREESGMKDQGPVKLAYLPMKYPVLSQTFIQRDVHGLIESGLDVTVMPILKHGEPDGKMCAERIRYISLRELFRLPVCVVRELIHDPSLISGAAGALIRLRPRSWEQVFHTLWGVFFAFLRAQEVRRERYQWLHAAWASAPATAAMLLSRLTSIPYSFGAHAYDIYRDGGDPLLPEKIKSARFIRTSTEAGRRHLCQTLGAPEDKVLMVRRGLVRAPEWRPPRKQVPHVWKILSVGRLVPKKGHAYQVEACRLLLKQGLSFELIWVGDGPLRRYLNNMISRAGLRGRIRWCGALRERETHRVYEEADIFWHSGVADQTGDRDGLPNVIPQAMSHGVPVISSDTPGPNEAVLHEVTGLLVPTGNAKVLAAAVLRLVGDADLRQRLSSQGRAWAEKHFSAVKNIGIVADVIRREVMRN